MPNEVLLVFRALIDLLFLLTIAKFSREWLYTYIVVNLLLITAVGAKLVPVFGTVTNLGNIFYASTFLAVYVLLEYHGTKAAYRAVWMGAAAILFFEVMLQIAVSANGLPELYQANQSITLAFELGIRIALASVLGFVISQYVNIWLFDTLQKKIGSKYFWLPANLSNALVQILDTALFFFIAFLGVIPLSELWQSMLVGYLMKVIFVFLATPLLGLQLPAKRKRVV